MYNYLGVIRKSTSIDHCVSCYFFDNKNPNLILSKNNRIEIYNLTPEGISPNKFINIYGKIKILLTIPNHQNNNGTYNHHDNLFVLSNDLNFCLFSYNKSNNNIDVPIMGTIKEDLGKIQDNILYSLDSNKNYLLICAYKNIFKIICVNNNIRLNDKYKNYTIRFQYEKILFLAPFYYDKIININKKNKEKEKENNILSFVAIKTDYIELENNNTNNTQLKQEIILETFQIKMDPACFNPPHFLYKPKIVSNNKCSNFNSNNINLSKGKQLNNNNLFNNNNTNKKKANENNINNNSINITFKNNEHSNYASYNSEKLLESLNFLKVLNIQEDQSISLMITHPDGLIIIFYSKYVIYYKYNPDGSKLISSKAINYSKRKFIDYVVVDENNFKYYVIDENGEIFLLAFLNKKDNENSNNINIIGNLQIIGQLNPCSCIAYLNNNILFIGSSKGNSQLIKINENIDNNGIRERIDIIEEYESLSPISNMALVNNTKEENGIEILTVSGVGKNCSVKNIKKGTKVIFSGDIEIKNIVKVFKVIIYNVGNKKNKTKNNNINFCSFVITTTMNSFIINYDYKYKIVSLNQSIHFKKNELVKFVQNIKNLILIVTNISIYIYQNDALLTLLTEYCINKNNMSNNLNGNYIPLIIKYNKNLQGLFIYYNNNFLVKYQIEDNKGKIINNEIILNNVSISSFDICKYFMIYSLWDSNKIGIYSFYSKSINYISKIDEIFPFTHISSIQIIKMNGEYCIFLSLSIGKMIYLKLREKININIIKNEFKSVDFILKRTYNLNLENFKISKIKKKNQKFLFLDTTHPCFIFFNNDNLIISNFNGNHCKDIIVLDCQDNNFLFIFNDKISFGSFSNIQNQNIYTLKSGKTINNIKLIDFTYNEKNEKLNNYKSMKYILTIEEEEIDNILQKSIKSSLVLNNLNMKEISKYDFDYDNEISMTLVEIYLTQNDENGKKYFVIGTGITDINKSEPNVGHLYLIEINIKNNFSIKKLQEIELKGGVYKIDVYENIIYVGIKNTLYIYSLIKKNIDNFYEFKFMKQCSDFTLINDIYVIKDSIEEYKDKKNKKDLEQKTNSNELFICDLYKSIILYKYDIINNKLIEETSDYNLTWIYSILQIKENFIYLTDIDDNIITLEKINYCKNGKDKLKLERKAFFNYGERINILISTEIQNKDLCLLTIHDKNEDSVESIEKIKIKDDTNIDNNVRITYFGTLEGSVGYIIQLNKETYEFLYLLQEVLIRKINNNGGFNYKRWRSFKDGYIFNESKGFIEGEIVGEFLSYDDDYKRIIVKEMNYPWKKTIKEIVHIIETLNNFY